MVFHCVRQNAAFNCPDLTFFDKLVVRLLRLMHISQKSFLPSFLYDLPVGHEKPLHASLYQTESFQDNANYDKFHHPALCAFLLISLIRENRGGSRCFSWGACCLIEWCWNCNPQPPFFLLYPAVTTSSLLSFHIFFPTFLKPRLLVWVVIGALT